MSKPPRAVVFDLDGLMFNTEELYQEVGTELLRRRGCEFTDELLHRMMGRPSRVALQMMIDAHQLDATIEQLATETEQIFAGILDTRLALMPGLEALLAALEAAELPKAIATSSGRRFTTNVLSRFKLEPRFRFILTAEDVTEGKPHPEIYLKAADRFALPPAEVLVLEDSANGCRAAAAAGTIAVAVPGPHNRGHDYPGAALIATSLADPQLLKLLRLSQPSD